MKRTKYKSDIAFQKRFLFLVSTNPMVGLLFGGVNDLSAPERQPPPLIHGDPKHRSETCTVLLALARLLFEENNIILHSQRLFKPLTS